MARILFVMTGADHWTLADGTKHPTGYWAEEFLAPYRALKEAGHEVVVATPGGVVPTVDRYSLRPEFNGGVEGAAIATAAVEKAAELRSPIRLEDVAVSDFAAVFYPGGHGPMQDLSDDARSAEILTEALRSEKPLAAVCHGVAALVATERSPGGSPFARYRVTGFTKAEEVQTGLADKASWLLQDRLVAMGVDFSEGEPWAPHVVVDRNLITGQNPASSSQVAVELTKALG
ncbi:type 1 glutamine amidotransferase domain-containing protein [Actinoplanes sp. NPDC049316]|uniref:type 1 glutamine amidotransferase domain-containing protein n=1 Tax=Actinoplanes sp. NPDC049316 TaxID=3154727 RepID=UPI0034391A25